jgi:PleD family two-component response regulator
MKVAVECKSILLQKALENFLGKHLCSKKHSEIIIQDLPSDAPNVLYVSSNKEADIVKPFSKSQLFLALQNRYNDLQLEQHIKTKEESKEEQLSMNFEILEKRIDMLTQEYKKNIIEAIKAFYG